MRRIKQFGFTLVEMLLVMVIMSGIIVMLIKYSSQKMDELRIDKAALQMQQILNAALSYYVNNSKWPLPNQPCDGNFINLNGIDGFSDGNSYLPASMNNPWGNSYKISCSATQAAQGSVPAVPMGALFSVSAVIPNGASSAGTATILAGRLPLVVPIDPQYPNIVTAQVNIPGQNLNNARSVNFASIYHSGACVPAPTCPPGMDPQIFVVPVSVSGVNDPDNATNVYPISSYTANAYGKWVGGGHAPLSTPVMGAGTGAGQMPMCSDPTHLQRKCDQQYLNDSDYIQRAYWRVCLTVVTEKGPVYQTVNNATKPSENSDQGKAMGSVLAITRCAPKGNVEPTGSTFNYYAP